MPDWENPTPQRPLAPSGHRSGDSDSRLVGATQRAMLAAASDLEAVAERLAHLAERLPPPLGRRRYLAELRGAIDCVRSDLLADAVDTLKATATLDEAELRRSDLRRVAWRVD